MANNALKISEMTACTAPAVSDKFYLASNTAGNAVPRSLTVNSLFSNVANITVNNATLRTATVNNLTISTNLVSGNLSANVVTISTATVNNLTVTTTTTTSNLLIANNTSPANSTANAISRQLWFDNNFVYAALSNNSIKRIPFSDSVWTAPANTMFAAAREKLLADRTYYVRTDGDDDNDGLTNTANGAFLTPNRAWKYICQNIDLNGHGITIQLADGTYPHVTTYGAVEAEDSDWLNNYAPGGTGGWIWFKGNTANVAAVVINANAASGTSFYIAHPFSQWLYISHLTCDGQTINNCAGIYTAQRNNLTINDVSFRNPGASGWRSALWVTWHSNVTLYGNNQIAGTWTTFAQAEDAATISWYSGTNTLTDTPSFASAFVQASRHGLIRMTGSTKPTFVGSATGRKYLVEDNSYMWGANSTSWPGSSNGTVQRFSSFDTYTSPLITYNDNTSVYGVRTFNIGDVASVPGLLLEGDRATPTAGDNIYASFKLSDSAGNQDEFARITAAANVVTSGSEAGQLTFSVKSGASLSDELTLSANALFPSSNGGLEVGTVSNRFANVFLANAATINFANDFIITHAPGQLTLGNFMLDNESTFGYPKIVVQGVTNKALYITSEAAPGVGTDWSHYGGLDWYGRDSAGASRRTIGADFFVNTADAATYTSGMTWYWLSNTANRFLNYVGDSIYPSPNDSMALGKANNAFSDVFLANGATINFANDFIITHAPGQLSMGPLTIDIVDSGGYPVLHANGVSGGFGAYINFQPHNSNGVGGDFIGGAYCGARDAAGTQVDGSEISWITIDPTVGSVDTKMTLGWVANGAQKLLHASESVIYPAVTNSISLGNSTVKFTDLYLARNLFTSSASISDAGVSIYPHAQLYTGTGLTGTTPGMRLACTASLYWTSGDSLNAGDTFLYRDAASIIAQRDGTTAQTLRVYNTYTDADNGEWGALEWSSNTFQVVSRKNGTGTNRTLRLATTGGDIEFQPGFVAVAKLNASGLTFPSDNTYDIGASGASRPRNLYLGSSVITGLNGQFRNDGYSSTYLNVSGHLASVSLHSNSSSGTAPALILQDGVSAWLRGPVEVRAGTTAQSLSIYTTYTDSSNYSRLSLTGDSATFTLDAQQAGTGTMQALDLKVRGGNYLSLNHSVQGIVWYKVFYPGADNTYDIGKSSNRVKDIYYGGQIINSGQTVTASTPVIDLAQTWNNSSATFAGIKFNVTETAAASGSALLDLQKSGTSIFTIDKDGQLVLRAITGIGTNLQVTGSDGVRRAALGSTGLELVSGAAVSWSLNSGGPSDTSKDLYLYRDDAGILAQRNGTNAQTLRVYNTYSNSTNYERGVLSWQSDNLVVGTEKAGSGADRALILQAGGTMLFATAGNARWRIDTDGTFKPQDGFDNTSDIGSATNRPRNLYVANAATITGKLGVDGRAPSASYSIEANSIRVYEGLTACTYLQVAGSTATLGYGTGSGGTVTQATSKSTGVTLNRGSGKITMDAASLAATTTVAFTLTNSVIGADDVLIVNHTSGGTAGAYQVWPTTVASGSCVIQVRNITGGSLGEAIVLSFAVIKGATS